MDTTLLSLAERFKAAVASGTPLPAELAHEVSAVLQPGAGRYAERDALIRMAGEFLGGTRRQRAKRLSAEFQRDRAVTDDLRKIVLAIFRASGRGGPPTSEKQIGRILRTSGCPAGHLHVPT